MPLGEHEKRAIASKDRVVQDPETGVLRQIVAGQEIPPDLVDAPDGDHSVVDHDAGGKKAAKAKQSGKDE